MKYIDADRLRAEIKRQIRLEELNFAALGGGGQTFCINTLEWVLKRIDSLQQEQSEVDIEKCKKYDEAVAIAKAWYKASGSSPQERNVARMIMGDIVMT